jgi:ubiquinone/menaquinone biosynthesis C-methylase UbiE
MNKNDYQAVENFYDTVYYSATSQAKKPSFHLRKLAEKINIKPGEQLLDIACGTGAWLEAANQSGAQIHGIDISTRAIEVCRKRLPDSHVEVGIAENLPFPDAFFDIITCLGSLEHFLDQPKAIEEMVRVAKLDARFLILVPNAGFLTYRLRLFRGTQQQAIKETIRSLDDWKALFSRSGLTVESRWADYHILSIEWILRRPYRMLLPRLIQAIALLIWPLKWQYQVYHLCYKSAQ